MQKVLILFLIITLTILYSCTKDKSMPKKDNDYSNCDTTKTSWCSKVKTIVSTTCAIANCHVSGFGSGDFTTYAGVKTKVDAGSFKTRVITNGDMPPSYTAGPLLSASDKQLIQQWLDNGAPEN